MAATLFAGFVFFSSCQKEQVNSAIKEHALLSKAKDKDQPPVPGDDAAFDAETESVMHRWFAQMNAMEMTCEPDVTFARMQIMHHQMGVEMAEVALKYEHHKEAIRLTEKSRDANLKSIERLQRCLAKHTENRMLTPEQCAVFMQNMRDDMVAMQTEMENALHIRDRDDADLDFAELIIEHHKGAISMSQTELEFGHDKCMRTEADKLIDEQAKEIEDFSDFKNEHIYGTLKN